MSRYSKTIALGLLLVSFDCFAYITHEVKRGETLWGLSHKYNVTPEAITKLNPKAERGLKTGMILRIPENEAEANQDVTVVYAPEAETDEKTAQNTQSANDILNSMASSFQDMPSVKEVTVIDLSEMNLPSAKAQDTEADDGKSDKSSSVTTVYAPEMTEPEVATPVEEAVADETPVQTTINVLETPIVNTSVNEKPSYTIDDDVYIAHFGDSFAGISAKTGVSEMELIKYNPFIDPNHIKEGVAVRLTSTAPYIINAPELSVVDSIVNRVEPTYKEKANNQLSSVRTIAVMLPFDVENETISRQSLLATEFYKGFMIATQKATENRDMPLRIIAVDTQCDSIQFDSRLNQLTGQNVSVIIPPDDERQLEKIENFALNNNALVLNVLNIKDEGYIDRPNVIQCNISQKIMYDKAIKALMTDFEDYTPVILDLAGGKDEKMSFVEELRKQYGDAGKRVVNLSFKNKLESADIKGLDSRGKYVFIPKSGSSDVFNKISEALVAAIEENIVDEQYKVFGYPDWIAFRGEQEEALHNMGANIYSRFYFDSNDFRTEDANKEFIKWYGTGMEEVFPAQGLLGYDAGTLLYNALKRKYIDNDIRKFETGNFEGIQSAFKFTKDSNGAQESEGLINEALYIIEYLPGQVLYVKTI